MDWFKSRDYHSTKRIMDLYGPDTHQETDFRKARGDIQAMQNGNLVKGGKEHENTDGMGQKREMGESGWDDGHKDIIYALGESESDGRGIPGNGDINGNSESESEIGSTTEGTVASENPDTRQENTLNIEIHNAIESCPSDLDYGMSNGVAGIAGYAGGYEEEYGGYGDEDDEDYFPDRLHASGGYGEGYAEIAYAEEYADDFNCDCDRCCERRKGGVYSGCYGDEGEDDGY
jgi:hypothetical protein